MQQGVRAVEAYRRAVLIDGVTTDNETIAPVYKLEEICTLMRTSSLDIVRELLERILKRLDHKSPVVKQKALRLIKFAAGRAGSEFRREIQRQAPVVRNLLHYRGQPDALKGDALNKAVRETAQEALSAIFASDEKISAMEEAGRRIQGFGSTNYDMPSREEKKTVLDEMMGFGSSTFRQMSGMGSGGGSSGYNSSNSGSYRGPNLRRSLTSERESKYDPSDFQASTTSFSSRETFESRGGNREYSGGGRTPNDGKPTSQEERLLELVTTPGGVRLQPSRETVQNFLTGAVKLDGEKLGHALESKLQAHSWQVRLKAVCILEALLRQRDSSDVFQRVARMFEEDCAAIVECAQSPQASLREKSKKVLDLLGLGSPEGNQHRGVPGRIPPPPGSTSAPAGSPPAPVVLPDLMDGWDEPEEANGLQSAPTVSEPQEPTINVASTSCASAATDDLLGGFQWSDNSPGTANTIKEADPFAGMSLNTSSTVSSGEDLFSGLRVDTVDTAVSNGTHDSSALFEGLTVGGDDSGIPRKAQAPVDSLVDLMGGLSTETHAKSNGTSMDLFQGLSSSGLSTSQPANASNNINLGQPLGNGSMLNQGLGAGNVDLSQLGMPPAGGVLPQQMMFMNPAVLMQMASGSFPPNMLPQGFAPGALGFGGLNPALAQQQLAASLANMQRLGMGMNLAGGGFQGNLGSATSLGQAYNDGFDFSSAAGPRYTTEPKKEDTKAFDFLKDHISAQRKGS